MNTQTGQKNEQVEKWWNSNPFAYGISNKDNDQVGTISLEKMDVAYFDAIDKKFRKHTKDAAQKDNEPLLSNFVDYNWLKNKKVLDIAVGSGFSLVSFATAGANVTGIDLTDFGVSHASKNLKVRQLPGVVKKMDAQKLQFPDSSFDFVNAWGCLMHMPETEKAVKEIYRVLNQGGKTLAYMYNRSSWPFWFNYFFVKGILFGYLIWYKGNMNRITSRFSDGYSRGGNPLAKFYTPKQIEKIYKDAGFKEVKVFPFNIPSEPDNWPVRKLPLFKFLPKKIKAFLSKRFGYGLIVQATK